MLRLVQNESFELGLCKMVRGSTDFGCRRQVIILNNGHWFDSDGRNLSGFQESPPWGDAYLYQPTGNFLHNSNSEYSPSYGNKKIRKPKGTAKQLLFSSSSTIRA